MPCQHSLPVRAVAHLAINYEILSATFNTWCQRRCLKRPVSTSRHLCPGGCPARKPGGVRHQCRDDFSRRARQMMAVFAEFKTFLYPARHRYNGMNLPLIPRVGRVGTPHRRAVSRRPGGEMAIFAAQPVTNVLAGISGCIVKNPLSQQHHLPKFILRYGRRGWGNKFNHAPMLILHDSPWRIFTRCGIRSRSGVRWRIANSRGRWATGNGFKSVVVEDFLGRGRPQKRQPFHSGLFYEPPSEQRHPHRLRQYYRRPELKHS